MSYIIGIDPGNEESGYIILDTSVGFPGTPVYFGKVSENELKGRLGQFFKRSEMSKKYTLSQIHTGIEMVASYGMPVGRTVFDTCAVIGRLEQAISSLSIYDGMKVDKNGLSKNVHRIYRKRVSDEGINSTTMELYLHR